MFRVRLCSLGGGPWSLCYPQGTPPGNAYQKGAEARLLGGGDIHWVAQAKHASSSPIVLFQERAQAQGASLLELGFSSRDLSEIQSYEV